MCRANPIRTNDPIFLRAGAVVEQAVDLSLPGPAPGWAAARTYSSRATGSGALGSKWLSDYVDYRLVQEGSDVAMIVDATSKRVFKWTYPPGVYTSPGDSTLTLVHDMLNSQFIVTDWQRSEVQIFHNFYATHPGKLKEKTTLARRAAGQAGSVYTYNASHQVTQITTGAGQEYNLVFTYSGSKITKIEVRTGADTSTRIRQVEYTYYDSQTHSQNLGADGDLVQVAISALKSGGSVGTAADWVVGYQQYRYGTNGLLKAVFGPDAIARLIADRADIAAASDILAKGDDDTNNGAEDYRINDYASRQFTYYTTDVKTDNSGAGTSQDPKCVTVWAPSGENLQSKYGGTDVDEFDSVTGKYLVKTETVGGCASCGGGGGGVTHAYFYLQWDHDTADSNEVVWLVVEDTQDTSGTGIRRRVLGLNDEGSQLREVVIVTTMGLKPSPSGESFRFFSWSVRMGGYGKLPKRPPFPI
ncbi:MAG: DUF6531 domain-containing protein [Pirellulaceae bacterium]